MAGSSSEAVSDPDAQEELARLKLRRAGGQEPNLFSGLDSTVRVVNTESAMPKPIQVMDQVSTISDTVLGMVAQFKSGDMSISTLHGELRMMEDQLTADDYNHLLANVPDGKVRELVMARLAALRSDTTAGMRPIVHNGVVVAPGTSVFDNDMSQPIRVPRQTTVMVDGEQLSADEAAELSAQEAAARAAAMTDQEGAREIAQRKLEQRFNRGGIVPRR